MRKLGFVAAAVVFAVLTTPAPVSAESVSVKAPPTLVLPSASVDSVSADSVVMPMEHALVSIDSLSVRALTIARDSSSAFGDARPVALESVTPSHCQLRTVHRQRWTAGKSGAAASILTYGTERLPRLRLRR